MILTMGNQWCFRVKSLGEHVVPFPKMRISIVTLCIIERWNNFVNGETAINQRGANFLLAKKSPVKSMDRSRSGCSAVRVAYLNGVQVVAGSNPVIPTIILSRLVSHETGLFFVL